jgi:hypothetical protein
MSTTSITPQKRRGGLRLLLQVYSELEAGLGEDFSVDELLLAAQTLIEVTDEEYALGIVDDGVERPNYYTHDVDWWTGDRAWRLVYGERKSGNDYDDQSEGHREAMTRLRALYNPCKYLHRG